MEADEEEEAEEDEDEVEAGGAPAGGAPASTSITAPAAAAAAAAAAQASARALDPFLAICLSSRRNLCINPDVMDESERERVDTACRRLTASWVRERAAAAAAAGTAARVKTCDFFENFEGGGAAAGQAAGAEAASGLRGIYDLGDLKEIGRERGWCEYERAARERAS